MKKIIFPALFITTILLTAALVVFLDTLPIADAIKSKGNDDPGRIATKSYGSANQRIVCGDKLCSEYPGGYEAYIREKESGTISTPDEPEDVAAIMQEPVYNEILNPRQVEYQNIIGFNDLHIEAIRHLEPDDDSSKLDVIVHHHCKVYDDMTATCLLFPTGMSDQDKPYGIEYIITSEQFNELPDEEKPYWHYHLTELPKAKAVFPDLTDQELASIQAVLDETYGKVFYFWDIDDKYPIGEPSVLVIQDLPE